MCKFASTEVQAYRTVVRRIRKIVQRPGSQIKEEVIPSDVASAATGTARQLTSAEHVRQPTAGPSATQDLHRPTRYQLDN